MKNTIKLAVVAAMAMGATSAFATNGDSLIGLGAKSRSMGGTGIAHYNGAESGLSNPALIAKVKGTEFSIAGTYFAPDVEYTNTSTSTSTTATYDSEATQNVIPEVALAYELPDGFAVGLGLYGTAGMGTDYKSDLGSAPTPAIAPSAFGMTTDLLLLKFALPIAYGQDNWSVGIAPVMMFGKLAIAYDSRTSFGDAAVGGGGYKVGSGTSQDFGWGYEAGVAYTFPDYGVTLGLKYQSGIKMSYEGQISTAAQYFGLVKSDELEQPEEYGAGVDWTQGDISLTFDWKQIKWGKARGYKSFNWENQNVYSFGAEYRMDDLALRAGYNFGNNPIRNSANTAENTFNAIGFPAIAERHYTLGLGYRFTKNVAADFAFTYAKSGDQQYDVINGTATVTNDQTGVTASLVFNY